jgi:threonine dehydrogenase-like Zn-dependent dehydrogenase
MKGLLFERNIPRIAASRIISRLASTQRGVNVSPLRLLDIDQPALPGPQWQHIKPILAGICGSDISLLEGKSSRYYEQLVSFPFVPGHEIVGTISGSSDKQRVVIEPVLSCAARGIDPPCRYCAAGNTGQCINITSGHLHPGLMIGYCSDTGGGWSVSGLVAHDSQIHPIPSEMSDADAVMVEPTACAIHAALSLPLMPDSLVGVIGSGTLGLTVIAALRKYTEVGRIIASAKYPHQRDLALSLGADQAPGSDEISRAIRRSRHSTVAGMTVQDGADIVFDCVGSRRSIEQSLEMLRPGGHIVLVGMGYKTAIDLSPLWHRELSITGSYTYGMEKINGNTRRTFDMAIELAYEANLGRLVSAAYPLERYEEAIEHAATAGSRGAVKIVFDLERKAHRSFTATHTSRLEKHEYE